MIPLNENDLNTVKGLMHYAQANLHHDSYDVEIKIGDSNGEVLGYITRIDDEYQFLAGDEPDAPRP